MFFNTFVSERGPAWRAVDLFDDLHQNIGEQLRLEEIDPSKVLRHIQSLAEEFYRNENFFVSQSSQQKIPQPSEGAMTRIHQPIFPHLNPDLIGDIIDSGVEIHQKEVKAFSSSTNDAINSLKKLVPMRPNSSVLPHGDTRLTK